MILLAHVLTETEQPAQLWLPNYVFAIIAFSVFLALGVITWTYRDVANRHNNKVSPPSHDDHQHGAGH